MTHSDQPVHYIMHKSEQTAEEILAYWTPERMADAQPVSLPTPPVRTGLASRKHHTEPDEQAFQTTMIRAPRIYLPPYQSAGKLFWTFGGRRLAGSAAVVNQSGIMTAAHCLYEFSTKLWAANVLFCPAYTEGSISKFGAWSFTEYGVPEPWTKIEDFWERHGYDVGLVTLELDEDGVSIGKVVGQLDLKVGLTPDGSTSWHTLGYPARATGDGGYHFNGEDMWECRGNFTGSFKQTVDKEGNLTAGSSGGPWLLKSGLILSSTVNGVQSGGPESEQEDFSSDFRNWVTVFYTRYFG